MKTSFSSSLSVQSVRVQFDRGFAERPTAFYVRLNLRDWLDTLDWLYAEASDRLYELEGKVASVPIGTNEESSSKEINRERDILRMLEDEIREADRAYCRLALDQR